MTDPLIVLGLDIGDRHNGAAIGNVVTQTATPLPDLPNDNSVINQLLALHQQYNFSKIIVGLPVTATGKYGIQAQKVKSLAETIKTALPVEIILEDERFTTQAASKFLRKHPHIAASIDAISAQLIVEGWLGQAGGPKKSI